MRRKRRRRAARSSLATAADELLAYQIATRLGFVQRVVASDGSTNLKGHAKAAMLDRLFPAGFIYAGDSTADLPVWRAARDIIVVRASEDTLAAATQIRAPLKVIPKVRLRWRLLARAIRLKQWSKNALVLAPIALSGRLADVSAWVHGIGALAALGLVASATYLVNDIVDLADDRRHWSKRKRPLASGDLPLSVGMALVPVLGGAGLLVATLVGGAVPAIIGLYAAITLAYSARLKRIPILDVVVLAGLFTLRLFLGVMAIGAAISPWLFVFSMALFLSLSVAKRHTEVVRMIAHGLTEAAGRGYQARDEALLLAIGIASAASAIVLLTLYLTGEAFRAAFYTAPAFLWFAPGVLLLWLGRVWLLSQRGELDDDPVAFALQRRAEPLAGRRARPGLRRGFARWAAGLRCLTFSPAGG